MRYRSALSLFAAAGLVASSCGKDSPPTRSQRAQAQANAVSGGLPEIQVEATIKTRSDGALADIDITVTDLVKDSDICALISITPYDLDPNGNIDTKRFDDPDFHAGFGKICPKDGKTKELDGENAFIPDPIRGSLEGILEIVDPPREGYSFIEKGSIEDPFRWVLKVYATNTDGITLGANEGAFLAPVFAFFEP